MSAPVLGGLDPGGRRASGGGGRTRLCGGNRALPRRLHLDESSEGTANEDGVVGADTDLGEMVLTGETPARESPRTRRSSFRTRAAVVAIDQKGGTQRMLPGK